MAAREQQLQPTEVVGFPSMAVADIDHMALSSIKAVSPGYPLRGELLWSSEPYGEVRDTGAIPEAGEVWLAPRLFSLLDVEPGDSIFVGEQPLRISGAVGVSPTRHRGLRFWASPLMNTADIPATGVIQPGSRVEYRLLLSGTSDAIAAFTEWVEPQLGQGQRLDSVEGAQPSIGETLDRAQGFLLLAGSLAVVLAAAAITLASRRLVNGIRSTWPF